MQVELSKARWSALLTAASNGDESAVRDVLTEDSSASACKDSNGWTPLMRAAAAGHKSIVNLLLTAPQPSPSNSKNKFGKTALHYACASGQSLIARVLLMYGCDPRLRDAAGNTAFDDALSSGHRVLVEELCARTPGVGLPPPCEPPVLFKADGTTLTVCWDEVETNIQAIVAKAQVSAEALSALPVSGYKLQLASVGRFETGAGPGSGGSNGTGGSGGRKWTLISADIPPGTGTYRIRGLDPGSSYMTRVGAYNGYGSGTWSDGSDVMTTAKARPTPQQQQPSAAQWEEEDTRAPSTPVQALQAGGPVGSPIMFWGSKAAPAVSAPAAVSAPVTPARATQQRVQPQEAFSPVPARADDRASESKLPPRSEARAGSRDSDGLRRESPSPSPTPAFVSTASGTAAAGKGRSVEEMRGILRTLQADLEEETTRRRAAEDDLSRLRAEKGTLTRMTVDGLTQLEGTLETAVRAVRAAKEAKMKEAIGDELSRTLCSVCMSRPKNILFLPCKHLCACSECANRIMRPPKPSDPEEAAKPRKEPQCPICRVPVREILDVYA